MLFFVDIDETICYYEDNERNYELALPYHDRIRKINELYDNNNTIVYWTARGSVSQINWFDVTYKQLINWKCKFNELRMGKPNYDVFIDYKNINSNDFF